MLAAAATTGPAPKVLAWVPGTKAPATSSVASSAPMGRPLANALARVMTSGVMPKFSWAKSFPVRPRPVWISSRISNRPLSSHNCRTPFK